MNSHRQSFLVVGVAVALALELAGCKPDLGDPPSLIKGLTVLAVRAETVDAEPTLDGQRMVHYAEGRPGQAMRYELVVASPGGAVAQPSAHFNFCLQPKAPAESNSVTTGCIAAPVEGEPAATWQGILPVEACMLFGPITPPARSGEPPLRPRDPDSTGGFYVPVRAVVRAAPNQEPARTAFALTRVLCNLAGAQAEAIQKFAVRYQRNLNPQLDGAVVVQTDGTRAPLGVDGAPVSIRGGQTVTIETTLATGASEAYPWFDPATRTIVDRVESLSVSWFVSAGELEADRTGRAEGSPALTSGNAWTAPQVAAPTPIHLWLVLRDSRGGVSHLAFQMVAVP